MEVIVFTFFNAVATVDVPTASNNDVSFVETQTVTFCMTIKSSFRFERINKVDRDRFLALANFIFCLPLEIPRDFAFIPSILKARAKMVLLPSIQRNGHTLEFLLHKLKRVLPPCKA